MKNILITGGSGFIGSRLALILKDKGYNITVFDNLSPQIHGAEPENTSPLFMSVRDSVNFFHGDVKNKQDWKSVIREVDAIVHLAAETGTGQSMYEIKKYSDTNIGGTAQMLEILANEQHSVKKIIVASSRAIYGEGKYECEKHGVVFPGSRAENDLSKGDFACKCPLCNAPVKPLATSEESILNPTSIYGISKQSQEQMVLSVGKAMGIPAVALRFQNVYGPGQSLSNPYTGILSIFTTRIKNGNEIRIFEDGKESRDFVYIDDVVDATVLALESDDANYEVFNVGFGAPIDVITVAETLRKAYQADVEIKITGNYRVGDIRHNYADLSKSGAILNYKPKVPFEQGIGKFCEWARSQQTNDDLYLKSIFELQERGLYK